MPPNVQEIIQNLSAIVDALAEASANRDKGVTLDLSPLTAQAAALCDQIIALPAGDAAAVLPDLQKAVEILNRIQAEIKPS